MELETALSVSKERLGCLQKMQAKRKHEETENDPERAGEDHAGEDESESRNRRARAVYDL